LRAALISVCAAATFLLVDHYGGGLCGGTALGETAFDAPETRAASDVVLPALRAGPHYRVDPTVRTFAFMNQYSVTSDYGAFAAPSDARLRQLIREIAAIAELQKIHQSDAFAKATVEAGKGVIQGAQQLIENPVATKAKSYELRAAMSLARLRGERSRRTEVRDLLAPIHGWFTEGFETADLREAKALLDQLA